MPSIQDITNLISTLGFPIFMCLYFMYAQMKASQRHDALVDKIKCVEEQVIEGKLQVGQVIQNVASPEKGDNQK
jgi:hypothetical protein